MDENIAGVTLKFKTFDPDVQTSLYLMDFLPKFELSRRLGNHRMHVGTHPYFNFNIQLWFCKLGKSQIYFQFEPFLFPLERFYVLRGPTLPLRPYVCVYFMFISVTWYLTAYPLLRCYFLLKNPLGTNWTLSRRLYLTPHLIPLSATGDLKCGGTEMSFIEIYNFCSSNGSLSKILLRDIIFQMKQSSSVLGFWVWRSYRYANFALSYLINYLHVWWSNQSPSMCEAKAHRQWPQLSLVRFLRFLYEWRFSVVSLFYNIKCMIYCFQWQLSKCRILSDHITVRVNPTIYIPWGRVETS